MVLFIILLFIQNLIFKVLQQIRNKKETLPKVIYKSLAGFLKHKRKLKYKIQSVL